MINVAHLGGLYNRFTDPVRLLSGAGQPSLVRRFSDFFATQRAGAFAEAHPQITEFKLGSFELVCSAMLLGAFAFIRYEQVPPVGRHR